MSRSSVTRFIFFLKDCAKDGNCDAKVWYDTTSKTSKVLEEGKIYNYNKNSLSLESKKMTDNLCYPDKADTPDYCTMNMPFNGVTKANQKYKNYDGILGMAP